MHFISVDTYTLLKYNKISFKVLVIKFKALPLSLFQSMKPGDWSAADSSAHQIRWGATPSAGWTLHQEKRKGFVRWEWNKNRNMSFKNVILQQM